MIHSQLLDSFYLSAEQLENSPSRQDGIDRDTEINLRIYGCELIQEAGILLGFHQVVMATGQVLFHRFYCKRSMKAFNVKVGGVGGGGRDGSQGEGQQQPQGAAIAAQRTPTAAAAPPPHNNPTTRSSRRAHDAGLPPCTNHPPLKMLTTTSLLLLPTTTPCCRLQKVAATALWVGAKLEEVPEVSKHPRELQEKVMVTLDRCTARREMPDAAKLPVLEPGTKVGTQRGFGRPAVRCCCAADTGPRVPCSPSQQPHSVLSPPGPAVLHTLTQEYEEFRRSLIRYETEMLKAFGFITNLEHPHRLILNYIQARAGLCCARWRRRLCCQHETTAFADFVSLTMTCTALTRCPPAHVSCTLRPAAHRCWASPTPSPSWWTRGTRATRCTALHSTPGTWPTTGEQRPCLPCRLLLLLLLRQSADPQPAPAATSQPPRRSSRSLRTTLCVRFKGSVVACGIILYTARVLQVRQNAAEAAGWCRARLRASADCCCCCCVAATGAAACRLVGAVPGGAA